ncbi:hypothetical protein SCMU_38480 [Sinomonas cyclohexanicum]|uniref:Uncharacterized protein n=1 Tax=Sinomonas cyclohexanicum TaxID=322009 RepID=A0ABN6FMB6_SINCY|nr:hypothetical protein SCMU_38480 [Corynebacterium cyclohexanicum]
MNPTSIEQIRAWVIDVDGCLMRTTKAGGAGGEAMPGAAELVTFLHGRGDRVLVCTNASQQPPRPRLRGAPARPRPRHPGRGLRHCRLRGGGVPLDPPPRGDRPRRRRRRDHGAARGERAPARRP